MKTLMFQEKFPLRVEKITKPESGFLTLEDVCEFFREKIDLHPVATYLSMFDHYDHTNSLEDGFIHDEIKGAKNLIFCFGKKLQNPEVLAVRPRILGICETASEFVISFLEAPNPEMTKTMETWVQHLIEATPQPAMSDA